MIQEQKGRTWVLADGREVATEFIPELKKVEERQVARVFREAEKTLNSLAKLKQSLVTAFEKYIQELKKNEDGGVFPSQKQHTIYSFNREFKIVVELHDGFGFLHKANYRLYMATKTNPSSKDYVFIPIEINSTKFKFDEYVDYKDDKEDQADVSEPQDDSGSEEEVPGEDGKDEIMPEPHNFDPGELH